MLFKCARLFDEQALARVRDRTGIGLRRAHTALFAHIDLEGTRLTELARRVGVSKQAVAPLVEEMVEMGVLERIADPEDARAKRICFAEHRGRSGLLEGLAVLAEIEAELGVAIGKRKLAQLHELLGELLVVLEDAAGDE